MGFFKRLMRLVLGPEDASILHCNVDDWQLIIEQNVANNTRLLHKLDFDRKAAEFSLATQAVSQATELERLRNECCEAFHKLAADMRQALAQAEELKLFRKETVRAFNEGNQTFSQIGTDMNEAQRQIDKLRETIADFESRLGDHETRFASRTDLLGQPSNN